MTGTFVTPRALSDAEQAFADRHERLHAIYSPRPAKPQPVHDRFWRIYSHRGPWPAVDWLRDMLRAYPDVYATKDFLRLATHPVVREMAETWKRNQDEARHEANLAIDARINADLARYGVVLPRC